MTHEYDLQIVLDSKKEIRNYLEFVAIMSTMLNCAETSVWELIGEKFLKEIKGEPRNNPSPIQEKKAKTRT